MFWGSSAEIRRLQSELAAARSEVAALQAQNGDLKGELASVKATSAEHEAECNTLRAVLAHLAEFRETLTGSQQTLGQMAVLLKEERNQAIAATEVSVASGRERPRFPPTCIVWRRILRPPPAKSGRWPNRRTRSAPSSS